VSARLAPSPLSDFFAMPRPKKSDAYLRSLGAFVHTFAFIEDWMLMLLGMFSDVSDEATPALFSGVRVKEAISFFRRLYEAYQHPIDAELDDAFRQLAVINNTRNDILHYGAWLAGTDRTVSTRRAAHTPDRVREFPMSHETLDAMSADLTSIVVAFQNVVQRSRPWIMPPDPQPYMPRTWLYKSPGPSPGQEKPRSKTPKKSRPRGSSQA
jgi:hypothetical protein